MAFYNSFTCIQGIVRIGFYFRLSKCFHFNILSAWFLLIISISSVPFLSFLTVFGFKLFDNIFSILNGDSLLSGISSADSITMKDGK